MIPTFEDPHDDPANLVEEGDQADLSRYRKSWRWFSTVNRVCAGVKKVRKSSPSRISMRYTSTTSDMALCADARVRLRRRAIVETVRTPRARVARLHQALQSSRSRREAFHPRADAGLIPCLSSAHPCISRFAKHSDALRIVLFTSNVVIKSSSSPRAHRYPFRPGRRPAFGSAAKA